VPTPPATCCSARRWSETICGPWGYPPSGILQVGNFLPVFIVLYLTQRGHSAGAAGFVLGAFGLGRVLGNTVGGYLTDKIDRRWTIFLSAVNTSGLTVIVPFLGWLPSIVVIVGLIGVMSQVYRPGRIRCVDRLRHDQPAAARRLRDVPVRDERRRCPRRSRGPARTTRTSRRTGRWGTGRRSRSKSSHVANPSGGGDCRGGLWGCHRGCRQRRDPRRRSCVRGSSRGGRPGRWSFPGAEAGAGHRTTSTSEKGSVS
jgi:MFS transporter